MDSPEKFESLFGSFNEKYGRLFGKSALLDRYGVEIVNFKVDGYGKAKKPELRKQKPAGPDPSNATKGNRDVYYKSAGGFKESVVYTGEKLHSGNIVDGPAIVEYMGTTVVIPPSTRASLDEYDNLIIQE